MNENYIRLYKEVGKKYEKVPQKKQLAYLKQYKKNGNRIFLDKILYANLPLIIDIACSFNRKGENDNLLMDFISVGCEEGIKCLDRYTFGKGNCTVSSWIRNNVRNKIITFLRENKNVVKINTSAHQKLIEDRKKREKFFALNGTFPLAGQTLKEDKGSYKFKNEYEFNFFNGENTNGESIFDEIEDFNEEEFIPSNVILRNNLNNIIKSILTEREYTVMDLHYKEGIKMTDINKHLFPENHNEFQTVLRTGQNKLKIILNEKKYIYNLYFSHVFDKLDEKPDRGKELPTMDGILRYKNIYLNEESVILQFNKEDKAEVFFNDKKIPLKNDNKCEFEIFISKKHGVPISKMQVHNIHELAIKKIRAYMLKYKIYEYE